MGKIFKIKENEFGMLAGVLEYKLFKVATEYIFCGDLTIVDNNNNIVGNWNFKGGKHE